MKKNTVWSKVLCLALTAPMLLPACQKPVADTEQTLEIFTLLKGYGIDWTETLIEEFKKQDWVKEKYPELQIVFDHNDIDATLDNKMSMGETNTVDLFFSNYTKKYAGNPQVADLTDTVYNAEVPGENRTVKSKLTKGLAEANEYVTSEGETKYYTMTYVNGFTGILYNEDLLNELQLPVPATTDQFVEVMNAVKAKNSQNAKYPYNYSIMSAATTGYWYPMYSTWWAQYEGIDEYTNFYLGLCDNSISKDVLLQDGRLEALKVMENVFANENKFVYPSSLTVEYDVAQTNFLMGNGLFHCNGDYFITEMKTIRDSLKEQGYDYTIKYMKNPVISSIVDRLTSIKTAATTEGTTAEALLRLLIADIDNGITTCTHEGVSATDYAELIAARNMINSATQECALVPSYAKGKEIAFDFLRFMATDIACSAVLKSTGGMLMPFNYDVEVKDKATYDLLDPAQKLKIDMYNHKTMPAVRIPESGSFPLGRAGLTPLASAEYNNKVAFESVFGKSGERDTAQTLFDKDYAYWNQTRWAQALSAAGM